jgi:hypothetical protein
MTVRGVQEGLFEPEKKPRVTRGASSLDLSMHEVASSSLRREENTPFMMLNVIEVHIPEGIKRVLFSNAQADSPEIPYGDWIKTVIAQASFPKDPQLIEQIEKNLTPIYKTCSDNYKEQISSINIFEEDEQCLIELSELADQTRSNIGFNLLTQLAAYLSEQDRKEGVIAAVSSNLPSAAVAFLSSGDCDLDLKKRVFVWATENGHSELFHFLFPQMPINNTDRSELAAIAARSNQVGILEDILSSGKISERVRFQLIEEANSIQAEEIVNVLKRFQSKILS